nr:hypothetical protein NRS6120_02596 [Bacillus subtilis]
MKLFYSYIIAGGLFCISLSYFFHLGVFNLALYLIYINYAFILYKRDKSSK